MGKHRHIRRGKVIKNTANLVNCVYAACNKDQFWLVKTLTGSMRWIRSTTAHRLITSGTTWSVINVDQTIVKRCAIRSDAGYVQESYNFTLDDGVDDMVNLMSHMWQILDEAAAID